MKSNGMRGVLMLCALAGFGFESGAQQQLPGRQSIRRLRPDDYVIDFVSTAAGGVGINRFGDVAGTSYDDPGCGSFCLGNLETVVWREGERIVLPSLPEFTGITVRGINDDGWIAGYAGLLYTTTRAVVWMPVGDTYQVIDLGTLPGKTTSEAIGIDDQGRVVGWSSTTNFPPTAAPFVWTIADGMSDLSLQGAPNDRPLGISPGGSVATTFTWYRLDDPASFVSMPASPTGYAIGSDALAINDAGDQARFLISTSSQSLRYLFRFNHEGTWQLLSSSPNGQSSSYGVGSINDARDVTATVTSAGVVAYGPNGLAQSLASLVSPAYPGSTVTFGGPMNARGEILAQVFVGQSPRLVRLTPAWFLSALGIVVSDLTISAHFVPDPTDPSQDHCSPELNAHNEALVTVTVTMPDGSSPEGVLVSGRFLDDYWTNQPVLGTTDANGSVSFPYTGLCGVGALAFLVDSATSGTLSLNKNAGLLSVWAIPD